MNMNIAEIKNNNERLNKYEKYGFTKEAMQDEDWMIRLNAYENLGYTKETLQNDYSEIRQEEYKKIWVEEILEKKTL